MPAEKSQNSGTINSSASIIQPHTNSQSIAEMTDQSFVMSLTSEGKTANRQGSLSSVEQASFYLSRTTLGGSEAHTAERKESIKYKTMGGISKSTGLKPTISDQSEKSAGSTQLSDATSQGKKKVLKFRLFKSLSLTTDIRSRFAVGKTLGKGSFGEVRLVLNKLTNQQCAMKIVNKAMIGKH